MLDPTLATESSASRTMFTRIKAFERALQADHGQSGIMVKTLTFCLSHGEFFPATPRTPTFPVPAALLWDRHYHFRVVCCPNRDSGLVLVSSDRDNDNEDGSFELQISREEMVCKAAEGAKDGTGRGKKERGKG